MAYERRNTGSISTDLTARDERQHRHTQVLYRRQTFGAHSARGEAKSRQFSPLFADSLRIIAELCDTPAHITGCRIPFTTNQKTEALRLRYIANVTYASCSLVEAPTEFELSHEQRARHIFAQWKNVVTRRH